MKNTHELIDFKMNKNLKLRILRHLKKSYAIREI